MHIDHIADSNEVTNLFTFVPDKLLTTILDRLVECSKEKIKQSTSKKITPKTTNVFKMVTSGFLNKLNIFNAKNQRPATESRVIPDDFWKRFRHIGKEEIELRVVSQWLTHINKPKDVPVDEFCLQLTNDLLDPTHGTKWLESLSQLKLYNDLTEQESKELILGFVKNLKEAVRTKDIPVTPEYTLTLDRGYFKIKSNELFARKQ